MRTLLYTAALDNRTRIGEISSRIGLKAEAFIFGDETDLFDHVTKQYDLESDKGKPDCLFFDEAQFLTEDQVWQLCRVADELKIPVMCYGLRTDFQGKLFPAQGNCWRWPMSCARLGPSAGAARKPRWLCVLMPMAR